MQTEHNSQSKRTRSPAGPCQPEKNPGNLGLEELRDETVSTGTAISILTNDDLRRAGAPTTRVPRGFHGRSTWGF